MRYILLALLLSGCVTHEERLQRAIAHYGGRCAALGFKWDTDPWRNCMLQLRQQDVQAEASNRPRQCFRDSMGVVCY
jgi:hypothetical protein